MINIPILHASTPYKDEKVIVSIKEIGDLDSCHENIGVIYIYKFDNTGNPFRFLFKYNEDYIEYMSQKYTTKNDLEVFKYNFETNKTLETLK